MGKRTDKKTTKSAAISLFGSVISAGEVAALKALTAQFGSKLSKMRQKVRQKPLAPRGKTKSGSGIRIPVRSQQSIVEAMDRRKKRRQK